MVFNSPAFVVFAALFFVVWPFVARRGQFRWIFLTLASCVFYGWWDWRFVPLLLATAYLDFWAGRLIERFPTRRKLFLVCSLSANVGVLALFKYSPLIADLIRKLFGLTGSDAVPPSVQLILPVGISFYTFHSMSYVIDVYRGLLRPTKNVFHFFSFITMFSQLVAGPIVRATTLLPQLTRWSLPAASAVWEGLQLVAFGLFKKTVIADNLAPYVNEAFSGTPATGTFYWWIIVTMFAVQIYCDFSGYTDIARGLVKWMGWDLPLNFNHPYLATSLRDFWARWHISLSTWFRDYVYIPLGGSRGQALKPYFTLWVTLLLSGLWHGAAWTFLAWGALHAFFMSVERLTQWPAKLGPSSWSRALAIPLVMAQVWIGWVFFRAETFDQAGTILRQMFLFNADGVDMVSALGRLPLIILAGAIGAEVILNSRLADRLGGWRVTVAVRPIVVGLAIAGSFYLRGPGSNFIYFQF